MIRAICFNVYDDNGQLRFNDGQNMKQWYRKVLEMFKNYFDNERNDDIDTLIKSAGLNKENVKFSEDNEKFFNYMVGDQQCTDLELAKTLKIKSLAFG